MLSNWFIWPAGYTKEIRVIKMVLIDLENIATYASKFRCFTRRGNISTSPKQDWTEQSVTEQCKSVLQKVGVKINSLCNYLSLHMCFRVSTCHFFRNHFIHTKIFLVVFCNICKRYLLGLILTGLEIYKENYCIGKQLATIRELVGTLVHSLYICALLHARLWN